MITDLTGQQVGNYRLQRRLGIGGFASVYLGQHVTVSTHHVAIKILHLFDINPQLFLKEAETTAALVHPHIVRLFDFALHNGMPYLVMDYAPKGSLRDRHAKGTRVPLATVVQYLKEIGPALDYAHSQNIIHRDIKPENILVGLQDTLQLSDFGIALLSKTGRTSLGTSYNIGGTPYYMAPEMFRGRPEKASDQYSLGIMAYEWLCGTTPFTEGDFIQLGFQHASEPVPSLRTIVPTLDKRAEAVILRTLAKKPEERYASIQAFVQVLETTMQPAPVQRMVPLAPTEKIVQPMTVKETVQRTSSVTSASSAAQKQPLGTLLQQYKGHSGWVKSVAWSPDGTRLASASLDYTVQVWYASTGRSLYTYKGHTGVVNAVAWSPDGTQLASASNDRSVQVWRASDGQLLYAYKGHYRDVNSVAWSPDGKRLVSASSDETVRVWPASGVQSFFGRRGFFAYTGHTGRVESVAWSPDGTRLASASWDETVRVWRANNGKDIYIYKGPVKSVAWSPDGASLAIASRDGAVQIWRANNEEGLYTYKRHSKRVNAIAWSPDGERLASASDDRSVQVWRAGDGQLLYAYNGHTEDVNSVAWSPDGTRLATASDDNTVHIWQVL